MKNTTEKEAAEEEKEARAAVPRVYADELLSVETIGARLPAARPLKGVAPADLLAIIIFCQHEEKENSEARQRTAEAHRKSHHKTESERWRLRKRAAEEEMRRQILSFGIDLGGL